MFIDLFNAKRGTAYRKSCKISLTSTDLIVEGKKFKKRINKNIVIIEVMIVDIMELVNIKLMIFLLLIYWDVYFCEEVWIPKLAKRLIII